MHSFFVEPKILPSWQKKILEQIIPVTQSFAESHKGTFHVRDADLTTRIPTKEGYITVQVCVRGTDEAKLEVTGVKRNGNETKRTLFKPSAPDYPVDLIAFEGALKVALNGGK